MLAIVVDTKEKAPLPKEEGFFLVAGVGFEPTTFWL